MDAEINRRFLAKLADVLEVDAARVRPDFSLADRWDSVTVLATMALIDEQVAVTVPPDELTRCTSVAELLTLVDQAMGLGSRGR